MYTKQYTFFPSAHGTLTKTEYIAALSWHLHRVQLLKGTHRTQTGKAYKCTVYYRERTHYSKSVKVRIYIGPMTHSRGLSSRCKGQPRWLVDREPLMYAQNTPEPGRLKWNLCWGCLYFACHLGIALLQDQQNPGAGAGEYHTKSRCNSSISLLLINKADKLGETTLKFFGLMVT